jgi:acetylornithine deacetylase/succinyl-diaminopimelate desuccinylase-like protein
VKQIIGTLALILVSLPVSEGASISEQKRLPDRDRSLIIELTAYGRGGHGSSLNLSSAPHRLIRALNRIEQYFDSRIGSPGSALSDGSAGPDDSGDSGDSAFLSSYVASFEVLSVRAGEKINVTPDQAVAQIRLVALPGTDIKEVEKALSELVGEQVDLKVIGPDSAREAL